MMTARGETVMAEGLVGGSTTSFTTGEARPETLRQSKFKGRRINSILISIPGQVCTEERLSCLAEKER